jgi:glycosyltransferase involved in cell wall biosynthesis
MKISAVTITLNEEKNIERCLRSVQWADEMVVVDAESTDRTAELARDLGARVIVRPWPGSTGKQFQYAIAQAKNPWVFIIDADEEASPELGREIRKKTKDPGESIAFRIPRINYALGRWFDKGSWKESVVRVFRPEHVHYRGQFHQKKDINGKVGRMASPLKHYMAMDMVKWLIRSMRLARIEGEVLYADGRRFSGLKVLSGFGKFVMRFLFKPGFVYGWAGFFVSFQRFLYVMAQQISILELQLGVREPDRDSERTFR